MIGSWISSQIPSQIPKLLRYLLGSVLPEMILMAMNPRCGFTFTTLLLPAELNLQEVRCSFLNIMYHEGLQVVQLGPFHVKLFQFSLSTWVEILMGQTSGPWVLKCLHFGIRLQFRCPGWGTQESSEVTGSWISPGADESCRKQEEEKSDASRATLSGSGFGELVALVLSSARSQSKQKGLISCASSNEVISLVASSDVG